MKKLYIADFKYIEALEKLEKKVPELSRKFYYIFKDGLKAFDGDYYIPKSLKEVEDTLRKLITEMKKHGKDFKETDNWLSSTGGFHLIMTVEEGLLHADLGVCFREDIFQN